MKRKMSLLATMVCMTFATTVSADPCTGTLAQIVDCLNNKLAHVEVYDDGSGVHWIEIKGANVQIINNQAATQTNDGSGNLIVGHNEMGSVQGSHNVLVGESNRVYSYGSIVSGVSNTADAPFATCVGGQNNKADNIYASVFGGRLNWAGGQTGEYTLTLQTVVTA